MVLHGIGLGFFYFTTVCSRRKILNPPTLSEVIILSIPHFLLVRGSVIIVTTEVQNAMNHDTVQFILLRNAKNPCIFPNSIHGNKDIAQKRSRSVAIIKGDNIGVGIVL